MAASVPIRRRWSTVRTWSRALGWFDTGLLFALSAWSVALFVAMALYAAKHHLVFIGTDGRLPTDQLQYLAWIREFANHAAAGDLFDLAPSNRVFIDPMWFASGILLRLGATPQLALIVWKPAAVLVLFFGCRAFMRRYLPDRRASLALLLALFAYLPAQAVIDATGIGGAQLHDQIGSLGGELFLANGLWGYLPAAIAVGLMPIFLLGIERVVCADTPRSRRRALVLTCGVGVLVSWLHPWQGVTLLLVLIGTAAWERSPAAIRLLWAPAAAVLLPLGYYYVLSRSDSAWRLSSMVTSQVGLYAPAVFVFGLVPLLALAAPGYMGAESSLADRMLRLWPVAAIVTYLVSSPFRVHAFEGMTIPLAVLAVRGWPRLAGAVSPRLARTPLLAGALAALFIVPDLGLAARSVRGVSSQTESPAFLTRNDANALQFVAGLPSDYGVLAPMPLGAAVPGMTGHHTWVGDMTWTPDWARRAAFAGRLFSGQLSTVAIRLAISHIGPRIVIEPCSSRADLASALGPLGFSPRRFGCATAYVRFRPTLATGRS